MKKWQEFLFWVVCFAFIDAVSDFIKLLSDNQTLNKWTFVLVASVMLAVGWIGVFAGTKSLKNKKNEKRNSWIVGFVYFVIVWSVFMTFDVMEYSLENNMLNTYYFFGIGCVLMFIGWAAGRLDTILPKQKKKHN